MTQPLTRRLTLVLLALSVCVLRAGAQAQWMEYSHREGRLSVGMPCAPVWKDEQVPRAGTSAAYTSHLSLCRAGDEMYLVGWVDYEAGFHPDVEGELKANRDNTVKGIEGALLLTSAATTYQGLPALDFTARIGERHMTSRVVMQGRRPYQLAVITPLNADRSQNIGRFLTSFRVTAD